MRRPRRQPNGHQARLGGYGETAWDRPGGRVRGWGEGDFDAAVGGSVGYAADVEGFAFQVGAGGGQEVGFGVLPGVAC